MLTLENLRPGERVMWVIKKHWIVYIILILYFFVWLGITGILYYILWPTFLTNLIVIVFWLFISVFIYIEWINFELDLYVITNNRVIWVEQISFLNRAVSECNLWQVQEVNSKSSWLLANILNYWTLTIQTAWNVTTIKMGYCPDAMQSARKLLNIVDDYRDKQNSKTSKEL